MCACTWRESASSLATSPAATPARGERNALSDIGPILNTPTGWALVVLVLGWPVLLAAGVAGLLIGWLIGRKTRPWLGSIAGLLAGLAISVVGVFAYADGLIGP